jgi:hypothetical protein
MLNIIEKLDDLEHALVKALNLGIQDELESKRVRTGKDLLRALHIGPHRHGHIAILKRVYSGGRFHVRANLNSPYKWWAK